MICAFSCIALRLDTVLYVYITNIRTAKAYRKQGHASEMIAALRRDLKKEGDLCSKWSKIYVVAATLKKADSRKLFESKGFHYHLPSKYSVWSISGCDICMVEAYDREAVDKKREAEERNLAKSKVAIKDLVQPLDHREEAKQGD